MPSTAARSTCGAVPSRASSVPTAGKTTAFNMVTGFIRPDRGYVRFKGEFIERVRPHHIFRKGIARTFQIPRELRLMTVLENLMLVPMRQPGESLWHAWFSPGGCGPASKPSTTKRWKCWSSSS